MSQYASYYSSSLGPVSVARVLICKQCHKYIACMDDLLSRAYCGAQSPKAGLFDNVSNVSLGERKVWLMTTGAHTVRELKCLGCGAYVGFNIVSAHEASEKWKNGAYILERELLFIHSVYDGEDGDEHRWLSPPLKLRVVEDLRRMRKIRKQEPSCAFTKPLPRAPIPMEVC